MSESVILRGSLFYDKHPENYIERVVNAIRSWFSGELIISTWEGQEEYVVPGLEVDNIIFTPDPGPGPIQHWKRQVVSYQRGLEASSGEKVMVTRTDMIHNLDPFSYVGTYSNSTDDLKVFGEKLVVSNMMTIRPDSDEHPNCFRICDWFQVGHRDDIFKWSDVLHYVESLDRSRLSMSTCTETLWFLSVLKNKYGDLIDIYDSSNINYLSWEAIVNNFIVLDTKSTLKTLNLNWLFQPEYCPPYMDELTYKKLYASLEQ